MLRAKGVEVKFGIHPVAGEARLACVRRVCLAAQMLGRGRPSAAP